MKFYPIEGKLTHVGAYRIDSAPKKSVITYATLIFKEAKTDQEISVSNCVVSSQLDRYIVSGNEGIFLVGKNSFGSTMLGFRDQEHQAVNEGAYGSFKSFNLLITCLIALGLLLTITIIGAIIGIPLIILAIFGKVWVKNTVGEIKKALAENGFSQDALPKAI